MTTTQPTQPTQPTQRTQPGQQPAAGSVGDRLVRQRVTVAGMTCSHCERAITAELGRLPAVRSVAVDLAAGTVTIGSVAAIDAADVAAALHDAGYDLAP